MDKEQKNADIIKPNIQHQEEAPKTTTVGGIPTQECDLKKVLELEVLDL